MRKWLGLGVLLLVLWVVGWLVFKIASFFIHALLIIGLALVVWSLVKRGARRL